MNVPQIVTGKKPDEPFDVTLIPPLPPDSPFGNLNLKGLKIVMRLDQVNVRVREAFENYASARGGQKAFKGLDFFQHQFAAEEVAYWLKKTADEFIGLLWVLNFLRTKGHYPTKVDPDCIGQLLESCKDATFVSLFNAHRSFLKKLNEVANACKHSFINTDQNHAGVNEPLLFALSLPRNDSSKTFTFHVVSLRELVESFSLFYGWVIQKLGEWVSDSKFKEASAKAHPKASK